MGKIVKGASKGCDIPLAWPSLLARRGCLFLIGFHARVRLCFGPILPSVHPTHAPRALFPSVLLPRAAWEFRSSSHLGLHPKQLDLQTTPHATTRSKINIVLTLSDVPFESIGEDVFPHYKLRGKTTQFLSWVTYGSFAVTWWISSLSFRYLFAIILLYVFSLWKNLPPTLVPIPNRKEEINSCG